MPTIPSIPDPAADPQAGWTDAQLADPHHNPEKAARVNAMFTAIAPSYDLNNRLHSLGIDQHWRSVTVKLAQVQATDRIVDVACGTGDLTLKFAAAQSRIAGPSSPPPSPVLGIDFTAAMLPLAAKKAARRHVTNTEFMQGDALALPLPNESVDILSIAFGIRNVTDWQKAIAEFHRVLRPHGRLVILEFSLPTNPLIRTLYNFYFHQILPRTTTLISGDRTGAYRYLPQSVNTFISREMMQERMKTVGFTDVIARPLTAGIAVCYRGTKPAGG
jgi:demethylmenaquinone methyltransferase/2-methoxy-6-polyprenyl-1,4-benzoquinol methylase